MKWPLFTRLERFKAAFAKSGSCAGSVACLSNPGFIGFGVFDLSMIFA